MRTTIPEPLDGWAWRSPALRSSLERADELKLQVLLGWMEEDATGRPRLRQVSFRADQAYFYPASSVKTFAAVAALERLAELRASTGHPIDRDTPLTYHPLFEGEQEETTTVGQEIRKLAIVSDNAAFNRLYDLVGPRALDASLRRAGLTGSRIVHRLEVARSSLDNRRTPRIDLGGTAFSVTIPARVDPPLDPLPPVEGLSVGRARIEGDRRVEGPMDFSGKNRMPLHDLQRGLCVLVHPTAECGGTPFQLTEEDRRFLQAAMAELPSESADPRFDLVETPDRSAKFLLPGLERVSPRGDWRVVSKLGQAYGFSSDNAFVEHRPTGRSMFVAAALYTNADGVLNDDRYEYETVADPFFTALGEAVGRALAVQRPLTARPPPGRSPTTAHTPGSR